MNDHPNFEYDDRLFPFNDIAHEEEFTEDEEPTEQEYHPIGIAAVLDDIMKRFKPKILEEKEPQSELNPLETDGA